MSYQIFLHSKADKALKSCEEQLQNRIKSKIRTLRNSPKSGKRLEGSKFFSIRIRDYRVIYEIKTNNLTIIILFIGLRSKIYDNFLRWINKSSNK